MGRIKGRVLDFGCGHGADVDFLAEKGFDVTGYDPHHAPAYPEGTFDTILCHYVLNVLFRREQSRVLMEVAELLRPSGSAYFTVRRDLRRPGFRMHRKHRRRTYQCNVALPYESLLRTEFCEIYRYQHINQRMPSDTTGCPFCAPEPERDLLTESAQVYAMLDKYPVNEGHTLVIPKRHVADYFDLAGQEQTACWMLVNRVNQLLQEQLNPDGFNVGINCGEAAGQTINHVHIHVIPRYEDDVDNPTGGVRNVIPERGDYTKGYQ
jgi:diadenosine tetraphosphate (Ap4A) HIT family hydrolase